MSNFTEGFCAGAFVMGLFAIAIILTAKSESYKQGQIDALTGKVKYELVVQPDSTRTWETK